MLVRTGDTPASARAAMTRRPPHILVTTPESLYLLLTSDGGRRMMSTVRTVIVDEIHALVRDKRGSHLALSLERLEALAGPVQRIGLSATQKPLDAVGRFLVGAGRECALVDAGTFRELDVAIEVPPSPLTAVCSHEQWEEIYTRMGELIREHRTTLVFVNTRKMAERIAAQLTKLMGEEQVSSHHGSLSKARRLDAEQRLKEGRLRALVATASLELGIDIGDVDLVIQAGITPSFAVFLQRVGRSGHALGRLPKGRLFPLTQDELVCAAAIVDGVRRGELDRTPQPRAPLDILAQQMVAACVTETWDETRLFETFRLAWPYRDLPREDFDGVVGLLTDGRGALLHRDGVNARLRGTKRARIPALTSGGAIPDTGQYRVVAEPEAIPVGTLDEDFAIESNVGDIFQLGNTSWRILKVEPGVVRVADAKGVPPNVPFWFGEGPARTRELSAGVARIRVEGRDPEWLVREVGLTYAAAVQLSDYLNEGERSLGAIPTPECVVLERFFDESGGMQLVIHAPFGGRMNRAWGLALRKRFCRGFGFELQAAANEEAIVLSLGLQHSFPLEEVFDYLHPDRARELLVQALLAAPMFGARWRWNLTRALLLPRMQGGRRLPTPLVRMRAEDQLAKAFPQVLACPETLPPGEMPVPWEHTLVRQTIDDCLTEAMDVEGFLDVLRRLQDGRIRKIAVDTTEPSAFARSILNAAPYAFLDDAPLEERRTQAVIARRSLDPNTVDTLGALDADAVARVREEAWPQPESAEEVHEALLWMGYVTSAEAERAGWGEWLIDLKSARRVVASDDGGERRWRAVEASQDEKAVLRGRLEAIGPVAVERSDRGERGSRDAGPGPADMPVLPASAESQLAMLEAEGVVLRCRLAGRQAWCERRLLARIHRYTLERLRREIAPVTAGELWRFLACWQHAADGFRLEGAHGVLEVAKKLAGFEVPALQWESSVLPARVHGYRIDWLDQLTLSGDLVCGRLWGRGNTPIRITPLCLLPRQDLDAWLALGEAGASAGDEEPALSTYARTIFAVVEARGASFVQELQRAAGLLPEHFELGLTQLIGQGLLTCDSFGGMRRLITPPGRRRGVMRHQPLTPAGRWSRFRSAAGAAPDVRALPGARASAGARPPLDDALVEFVGRQLLSRYGVVFRRLLERERLPVPWRDLVRLYRHWELRGDVRGGRFVQRFAGEQYALPEAIELMRRLRRKRAAAEREPAGPGTAPHPRVALVSGGAPAELQVSAADPLNLEGILTPEPRVPAMVRRRVRVG
ncbi:MAG: Lhr family helicase [Candidatus Eiseniibacteriota bacterium]